MKNKIIVAVVAVLSIVIIIVSLCLSGSRGSSKEEFVEEYNQWVEESAAGDVTKEYAIDEQSEEQSVEEITEEFNLESSGVKQYESQIDTEFAVEQSDTTADYYSFLREHKQELVALGVSEESIQNATIHSMNSDQVSFMFSDGTNLYMFVEYLAGDIISSYEIIH